MPQLNLQGAKDLIGHSSLAFLLVASCKTVVDRHKPTRLRPECRSIQESAPFVDEVLEATVHAAPGFGCGACGAHPVTVCVPGVLLRNALGRGMSRAPCCAPLPVE